MSFSVSIEPVNDVWLVAVNGDLVSADPFFDECTAILLAPARDCVIDLSSVTTINSDGVYALAAIQRIFKSRGARLVLADIPARFTGQFQRVDIRSLLLSPGDPVRLEMAVQSCLSTQTASLAAEPLTAHLLNG